MSGQNLLSLTATGYLKSSVARHCATELSINLVRETHHVGQKELKFDGIEIAMQGLEDAGLQHARLFNHHRRGIALLASSYSVFRSILSEQLFRVGNRGRAEMEHQVAEEPRKMGAAPFAGHRNSD
jgi:hypothetical protein